MVAAIQLLRSLTRGNRPSGRVYGEPYVNFAENQFGIFDSGNTPRDLLGVPYFSTGQNYSIGNVVNNSGRLLICLSAVTAGAFDATKWAPFYDLTYGQGPIVNGIIVESHASNAVTFAIKTQQNADPSSTDPVGIITEPGTITWIRAPLSITAPAGAHFGTTANLPFRLWLMFINNSGTPVLALRNNMYPGSTSGVCSISGPSGFGFATATAISSSATAAQVTYGSSAVGTLQPMRVLAHLDYEAGQPTAGNWTLGVSRQAYAIPGAPVPGQVLQETVVNGVAQNSTTSSAAFANSNLIANITPISKLGVIRVLAQMSIAMIATNANNYGQFRMLCAAGTRQIGSISISGYCTYASQVVTETVSWDVSDYPGSTTLQQYLPQGIVNGVGTIYMCYNTFGHIRAQELMT